MSRFSLAGLALALAVLAGQPAAAQPGTCLLEVGGKTFIEGGCEIETLSGGSQDFSFMSAQKDHFVYVYVEGDDAATAFWNGETKESRAHDPLGELKADGEGCWKNDGARLCATVTAAAETAPTTAAVELPIFGSWDCEVMNFTLTPDSYTVSGKANTVASITQIADADWGVELTDGYLFALIDVKSDSLSWSSPQSGDYFSCRRM